MALLGRMRMWAALLLAVVVAHALLPIAPPTVRTSGSPFSASTLEVSTVPSRKAAIAGQAQSQKDPGGGIDIAETDARLVPGHPAIVPSPPVAHQLRLAEPLRASSPYPPGSSLSRAPPLS